MKVYFKVDQLEFNPGSAAKYQASVGVWDGTGEPDNSITHIDVQLDDTYASIRARFKTTLAAQYDVPESDVIEVG
jgi:hypothetical protein